MTETAASDTKTANPYRPCACSRFEAVVPTEDGSDYSYQADTGCAESTARVFAPGHDAKLKGFLIREGAFGHSIRESDGGMATERTAIDTATMFGFGTQVAAGIDRAARLAEEKAHRQAERAVARGQARAARESAKTAQQAKVDKTKADEKTAEGPFVVTIKMGRWTYPAVIESNGDAIYTNRKGDKHPVAKGNFSIVD